MIEYLDGHKIAARAVLFCFTAVLIILADFVIGSIFLPKIGIAPDDRGVSGAPNGFYHHDKKKNFSGLDDRPPQRQIYTNNFGFKDESARKVNLKTDKYRLAFIGDSMVEGVGLSFKETFVGIVARELGEEYEVLNLGVRSYSPRLYYEKLRYWLGRGLRVDELVVFIDISDVQDELIYRDFAPVSPIGNFFLSARAFLGRHSAAYSLAFRPLVARIREMLRGKTSGAEDLVFLANQYGKEDYMEWQEERPLWSISDEVYNRWGRAGVDSNEVVGCRG